MAKPKWYLVCVSAALATGAVALPAAAHAECMWIRTAKGFYEDDECTTKLATQDMAFELLQGAVWLSNGAPITTPTAITQEGEFLAEDTKFGVGLLCGIRLTGTVGTGGAYEITKVFTLSGTELKGLGSSGLSCSNVKGCEGADSELWPSSLPYKSSLGEGLELAVFGLVAKPNGGGELPTIQVSCLVLGIKVEETCSAVKTTTTEVINVTGGVELVGQTGPSGTCTTGGSGAGLIENSGSDVEKITLSGATLSISK